MPKSRNLGTFRVVSGLVVLGFGFSRVWVFWVFGFRGVELGVLGFRVLGAGLPAGRRGRRW